MELSKFSTKRSLNNKYELRSENIVLQLKIGVELVLVCDIRF